SWWAQVTSEARHTPCTALDHLMTLKCGVTRRLLLCGAAAVTSAACTKTVDTTAMLDDPKTTPVTPQPIGALEPEDAYVLIPGGYAHKSCVHAVPRGAIVREERDGARDIEVDGRVVQSAKGCRFPMRMVKSDPASEARQHPSASGTGSGVAPLVADQ